jgi:hypothetical protein
MEIKRSGSQPSGKGWSIVFSSYPLVALEKSSDAKT